MKHIPAFAMSAVLASSLGLATAATATPLAPVPLTGTAIVQEVAFGCGPGFHPNPWGICRPNWGWGRPRVYGPGWGYARPRPYYRPYGFYRPHRYW